MPSQDAKRASDESRRMSRRSLLQGAATAGAAGLAVTAMGAAATPAFAATTKTSAADRPLTDSQATGAITVHVSDVKTGDIVLFRGTTETRLRDKDLAARLARALA